jgi:hypothetical protein
MQHGKDLQTMDGRQLITRSATILGIRLAQSALF